MDTSLRNPLLPAAFTDRSPTQRFPKTGNAPPISLEAARNSSPQTIGSLTPVSSPLLNSAYQDPALSMFILPRKRKIEDIAHMSRAGMESRETLKNNICDECRQIDFDKVTRLGSESWSSRGVCIQKVGKRFRQRSPTDCLLCQMLFASRFFGDEDIREPEDDGDDELRAFNFLRANGLVDLSAPEYHDYLQEHPFQCVVVVPSRRYLDPVGLGMRSHLLDHGCPVAYHESDSTPEMFAVQNVSARFDASLVMNWLQYCSRNHKKLCDKSRSSVEGLKLIDCESLVIKIADPKDTYLALSYVWGSSDDKTARTGVDVAIEHARLPLMLPAVISDAIKVTKFFGFQYLWIDKFCIDQDDPSKKHDQIKQMGFVYENAELAIIAAAGIDENYGLPGVGDTPRKP